MANYILIWSRNVEVCWGTANVDRCKQFKDIVEAYPDEFDNVGNLIHQKRMAEWSSPRRQNIGGWRGQGQGLGLGQR